MISGDISQVNTWGGNTMQTSPIEFPQTLVRSCSFSDSSTATTASPSVETITVHYDHILSDLKVRKVTANERVAS